MVEHNAAAYRHRFTPLLELQRLAGDARRALFDTVFVYQKSTRLLEQETTMEILRETASVEYAVSLELEIARDGKLAARLTYDASKLPDEHAQLLLTQYEATISKLLGRPNKGADSRLHSIVPARAPQLPSKAVFLHDFVELSAHQYPDRPALEFITTSGNKVTGKKVWTYRSLDERANQLVHRLRREGIVGGSIIAVQMEKCPEASISFLAILKAGCAFLAIDPSLPKARQEFILHDSGAAGLLVSSHDSHPAGASSPITIVVQDSHLDGLPTTKIQPGLKDARATCYCLYTSGTTGTPKGCEISHENVVQAMLAFQDLFVRRWSKSSRWLQFASYHFDVAVLEHFWSWSVGITMVGAPRDLVLEDLAASIQSYGITHIALTPSLARLVDPKDVPSLHGGVFITGGEALKQEIIDSWGSYSTVCNFYGPTEATIGITANTFLGSDAKSTNIGRPFVNVGVFVLQPNSDQAVLRGAVGELCASGKLVGKGYLNRPDLTAKVFEHLNRYDERIYRTGDLVRLLADGSISFVGRKDTQTKIRGQRLEVAEIDNVIKRSSTAIKDALSLVIKSDDEVKQTLVSFCTAARSGQKRKFETDPSMTSDGLVAKAMDACRGHLPAYMVPTHIIPLTNWPLTANNKIDSKQLIMLYNSRTVTAIEGREGDQGVERPLNETEKLIGTTVAAMLKLDQSSVRRTTNFWSLGLSSVSAITLASLLKRRGITEASVGAIMQHPNIGELAALAGDEDRDQVQADHVQQSRLSISAYALRHRTIVLHGLRVAPHEIEAITPCTGLQAGLILESLRQPERPYFNEFRYRLRGIDHKRMRIAIERVVAATQMLRARFLQSEEGFVQVVLRSADLPWHHVRASDDATEDTTLSLRSEWLDMNQQQILRPVQVVILERWGWSELVLYAHHATYDGISWDLMMDALAEAYKNDSRPDCGPLFTDVLPYGPLCHMAEAERFWRRRMEGYQFQALSKFASKPDGTITATRYIQSTTRVEQLRKHLGVPHQALLQACFEVAIQQHFHDTASYGQVLSGRSIAFEGADRVIGPMFNTLPVAMSVKAADSWASLIKRHHGANLTILPFQHTPLRDIRKWSGRSSSDPMFDILFVFQHPTMQSRSDKYGLWTAIEQHPRADYPLAFELTMLPDNSLQATIVAQAAVAKHEALKTVLEDFNTALEAASTDPNSVIATDFSIPPASTTRSKEEKTEAQPYLNGVHDFSWTEQALELRSLIAHIAGVQETRVDEHMSIFALGMDSIDAVKLSSRAKKSGLMLPVSKILQAQTIPRMLDLMNEDVVASISDSDLDKELATQSKLLYKVFKAEHADAAAQIEKILPATPSQEGLVADMLRSDFQDYYNHDVLELHPQLDLQKLRQALRQVIHGSPILRTGFYEITAADVDATFAQVIWSPSSVQIPEVSTEAEIGILLQEIAEGLKDHRDCRSPLRLNIVKRASSRYLVISLAHAQYDGHSLALLHEDIRRAYDGDYVTRPHYDSDIQQTISSANQAALHFWSSNISGAQSRQFPRRTLDIPSNRVYRAERVSRLSLASVQEFCRVHSVSMPALAQTCWSLVLAHNTQALEVMFGVVLACRDSEEAEQIMFPMMNTVPMRAALHGSRLEMLRAMQSTINDIRPYQRTPLRTIQVVCSDIVGKGSGFGLFDTLFVYQHRPETVQADKRPLYKSVGGSSSIEYPVAVEMEAVDEQMLMRCACKDSVLDQDGTHRLLEHLDIVLESIVKTPTEPTVSFRDGGKVSVGRLPAFNLTSKISDAPAADQGEEVETRTELSSTVLAIREALAQVARAPAESIPLSATIESIGIDSISAIKVAAFLRKKSIRLPVSQIIQSRTITKMAKAVQKQSLVSQPDNATAAVDVVTKVMRERGLNDLPRTFGIDGENVQTVLPATAGQVYMLSTWLRSGGQLFHPTFTYEMETTVSEDRLKHAWQQLVARHDALRTVFCATSDDTIPAVQVVLKQAPSSFNASTTQSDDTEQLLQLMACLSTEQTKTGWLLKLKIHHALYDAVSLPLLMQYFTSLLNHNKSALLPISSAAFLALSLTDAARDRQKKFWTSYLRDVHPQRLLQPSGHGQQKRVELFKPDLFEDTTTLEQLARQEGITIQSLLFAAYAKIYASLPIASHDVEEAGRQDIILGIYLSNRSHLPDLDKLASPTLNLVPLRVQSPSTYSLVNIAKQIQKDLQKIGTAENSAVGLWQIAQWTGVKVDTFVNFLKLPEADDVEAEDDREGGTVLREDSERRTEAYARVAESEEGLATFTPPKELKDLGVKDAYPYSLDLEATVANGTLDVGLFCPEEMVGLEQAQEVIAELSSLLEKLVGKARE